MTRSQVQAILAELNSQFSTGGTLYGEGAWLAMDEVSSLVLLSNESIYPDDTMHVYFDGTNELIKLGRGTVSEGVFTLEKVESITMYAQLMAVLLERPTRMKSPYKISSQV